MYCTCIVLIINKLIRKKLKKKSGRNHHSTLLVLDATSHLTYISHKSNHHYAYDI